MSNTIIKKKRGRKPKNFNTLLQKNENDIIIDEQINSEEENVILHLPITLEEINTNDQVDMSLFIKSENDVKKLNLQKIQLSEESESHTALKSYGSPSLNKLVQNNNMNKIITHNIKFNINTKCWWCKNCFSSPPVQLPEDYYNETFFCIGHFCSFSCMKGYNLDINDSLLWKRESLINLLYYMTYSENLEINHAPHWMTLEEFGGNLTIEQFREKSCINTKDFLILHPPLVSRQMQIEESYKLNKLKEVPIDQVNKIYSEIENDYVIKRRNPIQSKQLNLETTMGLIKKKRSNRI
jgi:hypothetical protein